MSRILAFRDSVEAWVRTTCPELRDVDWYDGQFDITDLRNWTVKPPSAFIAASTGDDELVSTGESQANLNCVLVICDQDRRQGRDADKRVWELMERVFIGLRLQDFGNEWATASWGVSMRRLMDPVIRREGVAFGVVSWKSGVTLGDNMSVKRDQILGPDGQPITRTPSMLHSRLYFDALQQELEDLGGDGQTPNTQFELPPVSGVPSLDQNGFRIGAAYEP